MVARISYLQLLFVILLSNGLTTHVIIIPLLLDVARRDSWISVLASGGIYLLSLAAIYYISSQTKDEHLISWLQNRYPRVISLLIGVLFALFAFTLCVITVKDTLTWVRLSFSPGTPLIVHAVIFLFICSINSVLGIRSIVITSGVLLPFVILLGIFIMLTNLQHKDYSNLQPFLEYGYDPVWKGMIYSGAGFSEIILITLLTSKLKNKISLTGLVFIGFYLVSLTIGPLIGAIAEFGPDFAAKLRYPAFEEWRLASLGTFIEHVDFLSIYQWFSGAFIRTSLMVYLLAEALHLPPGKKRINVITGIYLLILLIVLLPITEISFYHALVSYLVPAVLAMAVLIFTLLFLLVLLSRRKANGRR